MAGQDALARAVALEVLAKLKFELMRSASQEIVAVLLTVKQGARLSRSK